MKPIIIYILIISLFIGACKEIYDNPPIQGSISSLVVEGTITNDPPPYTVNLTQSIRYNSNNSNPKVMYADVRIIDDSGNIENVTETPFGSGIYQTSSTGMQGKIGKSYKLKITLFNDYGQPNTTYESDWVKIPESLTIDSIYLEKVNIQTYVEQPDGSNIYQTQSGLKMYIDAKPALNQDYYYKFQSTMVYEYYQKNIDPDINDPDHNTLFYCWNTNQISLDNDLKTATAQSNPQIRKFNLGFIPESPALTYNTTVWDVPYASGVITSTDVYSVSKEIYKIFSEENTQTTPSNSIFDPIPTQLESNIKCTSNSAQSVLGYFNAASVAHAYQFFNYPHFSSRATTHKLDTWPSGIPSSGAGGPPWFWTTKLTK